MAEAGKEAGALTLAGRWALWRAARWPVAPGFAHRPEPRSIGLYSRGRQLLAGSFHIAGHLIEAPGTSIWQIAAPDGAFAREVQGFVWLDDLAALGDAQARAKAQAWLAEWQRRYGQGAGPGWSPEVTARRLMRWLFHADFLLSGRKGADATDFLRHLTTGTAFLASRWRQAPPGRARIEALTGTILASLALQGAAPPHGALAALATACREEIDPEGGLSARSPEVLLEVFTHLVWARQALAEAGEEVPAPLMAAIERMAPVLRALRHADGGLARFHGGGRGAEGRLDQALAASGIRSLPRPGALAMGFARLQGGRTSVIVDAADPPSGPLAHASTGAMELTSGRRPLIVSCGSGEPFGADWARAGRATASHSTLAVEGYSSSRFASAEATVFAAPAHVLVARTEADEGGTGLHLVHDGWAATHGLCHMRDLYLSQDGRKLSGIDRLVCLTRAERDRFDRLMRHGGLSASGVPFALRFHLHPDVDARLDMGGTAVSLALKSGEIWVFRHDGIGRLTLEPSVYLERARQRPRAARQIVLSAAALDFETALGWTLAKAQDTPLAIRDLGREEPTVPS